LHKKRLRRLVSTTPFNEYNLLYSGSDDLEHEENLSLLVSSPGHYSAQHTDDYDVLTHCFVGRKLWVAWDTIEGDRLGLEDVSRQDIFAEPSFDIARVLRLRRSCWFLLEEGQTLFMPHEFCHKVVTLDHYLGVGSFSFKLPGLMRSIDWWIANQPTWTFNRRGGAQDLLNVLIRVAHGRIAKLAKRPSFERRNWGWGFLKPAIAKYKQSMTRQSAKWCTANDELQTAVRQVVSLLEQVCDSRR